MKYHILLRITHWLMAICLIGLIGMGFYMEGLKPSPDKWKFYDLHKSFGILMIILFVVRIILRKVTAIPAPNENIKPVHRKLSKAVHHTLYLLMIGVPVAGYIMSVAGGHKVPFFGMTVPALFDKNKALGGIAHEVHVYAAYTLLALIVLHLVGVIKHRFFEPPENDVLKRML